MNYILFDDETIRGNLLPLTYTRPVSFIRIGISTIAEKWIESLGSVSFLTAGYLQVKYPLELGDENLLINGAICPDQEIIDAISDLGEGESLVLDDKLLARRCGPVLPEPMNLSDRKIHYSGPLLLMDQWWKIFQRNGELLRTEIRAKLETGDSNEINDPHTIVYNRSNLFVGQNTDIKAAVIDADNGPVFIGDHCTVMPGSIIRGPFAMLHHSTLGMGARMRGDITIGPYCKVAGEVANSVFLGYSNKGHDGYLGNSVIGEWCNLGADTNCSNMKNDYTDIKVWNYNSERFVQTGTPFCGLLMGDHSKSGINVMFNSGTSVGVSSSVYNANYPRNFIPSFVQGGAAGWKQLPLQKAIDTASRVTARRDVEFGGIDIDILNKVFELSGKYRR